VDMRRISFNSAHFLRRAAQCACPVQKRLKVNIAHSVATL